MKKIEDYDIDVLNNAYTNICEALAYLRDYNGLDNEYTELDLISQAIEDELAEVERKNKMIEEEHEYEMNKDEWEEEKKQEEWEYERSVLDWRQQ